jgi:hypothetical protein
MRFPDNYYAILFTGKLLTNQETRDTKKVTCMDIYIKYLPMKKVINK